MQVTPTKKIRAMLAALIDAVNALRTLWSGRPNVDVTNTVSVTVTNSTIGTTTALTSCNFIHQVSPASDNNINNLMWGNYTQRMRSS